MNIRQAKLIVLAAIPANPSNPSDRPGRPQSPDFKAAAKLGVTEQKLIDALGIPPHPPGEAPKKAK